MVATQQRELEDPERQELLEGPTPSRSSTRFKIAAAFLTVAVVVCWLGLGWLGLSGSDRDAHESSGVWWSGKQQKSSEQKGCPEAPLLDFYMYRAQTDENYSPVNQDMANIGGMLWYMHNEIIWHHWIRVGSFSSTPKTRLEQFRVKMRPTCQLWNKGLKFGVVNTYDLGECTGPYKCQNLKHYGPTVGCETWEEGRKTHVPHDEWYHRVKYPRAAWYSLPGACASKKFWGKNKACALTEPSGACPEGHPNLGDVISYSSIRRSAALGIVALDPGGVDEPTGEMDCTYTWKKVGEISIDELEGISSFDDLMKKGGYEYSRSTDEGKLLHFWDHINSTEANQRTCDFNPEVFYPHWPEGNFN